jgi:hypothetical protein
MFTVVCSVDSALLFPIMSGEREEAARQLQRQRTAERKAKRKAHKAALLEEATLSAAYPEAHLPPPPASRVIIQEWIIACLYPAHTGRDVINGQ